MPNVDDDGFVHFTCTGCNKKFKKKRTRGRPPTRCTACREASPVKTVTLMCIDCDKKFTHPVQRGRTPVRCLECRSGGNRPLEVAFEAVEGRPGEWVSADGTTIHKVSPQGHVLFAVRLPGSKRPEWVSELSEAKGFADGVQAGRITEIEGRTPGHPRLVSK